MTFLIPKKNRKGEGIVTGLVVGVGSLIVLTIVSFLIVETITGAGLLTTGSFAKKTQDAMVANYSVGVDSVSAKIPTILLIGAVVLLFGAIVLLVMKSREMTGSTSQGSL